MQSGISGGESGNSTFRQVPVSWIEEQEGNVAEVDWPGANLCISPSL